MIIIIKDNLGEIKSNIEKACKKINRNPNEITIVGVTKTITIEKMKQLQKTGINDFGENRVQELIDKFYKFDENINWHQIGHLQRNKVKFIVNKVKLVHSVDSIRLLTEIDYRAKKENVVMNILAQINIANEESKYGLKEEEVEEFINATSNFENVYVKGLMTVAPYTENPEESRIHFKNLKILFDKLKQEDYNNVSMEILSMGMTNDYVVAIEEGANMVRIGTGIFGKR